MMLRNPRMLACLGLLCGAVTAQNTASTPITVSGHAAAQTTIPAPGFQPSGLAYDGTFLYVSELSGFRKIFKLDPTNGAVSGFFPAPGGNPNDIVFDGVDRLFVSDIGGTVYEIDTTGMLINSFPLPFGGGAIAFDGTNLYIGDFDGSQIRVTDRLGTHIRTFDSGLRPAGMVFDPATGNLWVISGFDETISEITTEGVLVRQCDGPRNPGVQGSGAVTLVGSSLYIAEVSDPDPFTEPEIPGTIFIVDPRTLPSGVFQLEPPSGPGAMGPNLSVGPQGVILSWLEPAAEAVAPVEQGRRRGRGRRQRAYALRWATLEDGGWSAAKTITEGENFFANWADFPTVVAGSNGSVLASWLANNGRGTFGYGIQLALSADGGDSWKPLGSPHSTEVASEYGFVSILAEDTGFRVYWLDGRELGMSGGGGNGQMSLRTALVQGGLGEELVLDADVCTCCQTSATVTASGPALVYRDHEEGEIRDISIVRQTGQGWSEPQNVHGDGWRIGGCPVNGPAIAAMGNTTAVAWFTQAEDRPMVRVAFSRDGGGTFGDAITLDVANPVGRVAVVGVSGGAVVGWLGVDGPQAVFRLRHVTADGVVGPAMDLGHTASSRDSGFPRMVSHGDDIVLAWRETGEPAQLRTALLPLSALANSER